MKYTKLFNNHEEYAAYTASTNFIRPNISFCVQDRETHCTPAGNCQEAHEYALNGQPTYPLSVPSTATSFEMSFEYTETYTSVTCVVMATSYTESVTVEISENMSTSARMISGTYVFNGMSIPYNITQEGMSYANSYLTLDVLTGGTIMWVAKNGVTKTISYSVNNGEWTEITSSAAGTPITVSEGDSVRLKGTNDSYASGLTKNYCSCFSGGTAYYNIKGNVMSLVGGDNFASLTSFNGVKWVFHSLFDNSKAVSAENLVLPVTTLTTCCYRAMFANAKSLIKAPALPATTLADACYWFMFENTKITEAPELNAEILKKECYGGMFTGCTNLNYIKCMATSGVDSNNSTYNWVNSVASSGTFVKDVNTTWPTGVNGIPSGWNTSSGVENPTIYCNGEEVTISCTTQGASIYYKLDSIGEYALYSTPIAITANTLVEAYATSGILSSNTVSQTCAYSPIVVANPVIESNGQNITITCSTQGASIYYKLDHIGDFALYSSHIVMTADTFVEAYATLGSKTSSTVSKTCEYSDSHDYSLDYLTFDVLSDGTILWKANSGVTKTISYSKDNGSSWTEITSTSEGAAINVNSGDTVLVKGNNQTYGTGKDKNSGFNGGTATYNAKGNIMSLIGGDDFTGLTSFSSSTYVFHKLFAGSNVVSAKYLVLPVSVLTDSCYRYMFGTATNLTEAPEIHATTLAVSACCYMYQGCTSLTAIPNTLSAATLADSCYKGMFSACTSLTTACELPAIALANNCYDTMFKDCTHLVTVPSTLPATTLKPYCYINMFRYCKILTTAPELPAATLANNCYDNMFRDCSKLNYIKCLATDMSANGCTYQWVYGVQNTGGTFIKDASATTWTTGVDGIPTNWTVVNNLVPNAPTISCNGLEIELSCSTEGADIYYQLDNSGSYTKYTTAITMTADTYIECYSENSGYTSEVISMNIEYDDRSMYEYSNQSIDSWTYNGNTVTVPNSVNAIDGHSSNYSKGTFNYETDVNLRNAQTTYLWFQHADQTADVYVDNTEVEKHWGGYNAFFVDISNNVHKGTNNIKVALKNNEGDVLAPYNADFNFNATLGEVKLFTSPYIPSISYGYDGFHITSTVSTATATVNVATTIPTGASVVCTISGTNCNYTATSASTGSEMIFTTTISNPHLWNGTIDPYLYNVKLEIYHNNELYHRYERPYGLRFYEYVINQTINGNSYTGFLLNGQPYSLRGVCMHDDLANKANALNDSDYAQEFSIIQELGCNFIRLAHYPHPKQVYDWCDRLGIVVQTEAPWVNKSSTAETESYWTHLEGQITEMVNQHYNHPCIMFWGVGNEINQTYVNTTEGKDFVKGKIESYRSIIRTLMPNAWVGYTVNHNTQDGLGIFNNPTVEWIGQNIYVGWYIDKTSNNPTNRLTTAINNAINNSTPCAFSEYGAGGTQTCHSDDFMTTTTTGNNPRHDIEYQMWLHEGHIAAINNKPELLFTSQWQLFDIAVSNRQEGYKVCLDGETVTDNDNLKYLNNKGLVERDHTTKKDTFYLYKAWWNTTDKFVHICGKNYTKKTDRTVKCYTNDGNLSLYVNNTLIETAATTNNICTFTARNYNNGDLIRVNGSTTSNDSFNIA